jgi:hypothetical protein
MNLDRLSRDLGPIVQVIDDWYRNYKLGLVFECRVGAGKLMVCSADLESELDRRPAARQLRHSLLTYMSSGRFDPAVEVTPAQIRSFLFDNQIMAKLGASAKADKEAFGSRAGYAVDGNPNTCWLAGGGRDRQTRHPYELTIEFAQPTAMTGLLCMARQNHRAHEGDIREYAIEVSDDGELWEEVTRGELESTFEPQQVGFGRSIEAKFLKLRALSGFADDTACALAELAVLRETPRDAAAGDVEPYRNVETATEEIEGP